MLSRPHGIALDGLLASVLWHRHKWAARAEGRHVSSSPPDDPDVIALPLATCGDPTVDADWHWMATFSDQQPLRVDAAEPDIRWRFSRTDRARLQHLSPVIGRGIVHDSIGRYQRRVVPVMATPTTSLTWRAVGDGNQIRDLLSDLTAIGKHRGVGEGIVTHWEVTSTPEVTDWSAAHEHEPGVLGRPTPQRCLTDHHTLTGPAAPTPSGRHTCIPPAASHRRTNLIASWAHRPPLIPQSAMTAAIPH